MRKSMLQYYQTMTGIYDSIVNDPENEKAFEAAGKAIAQRMADDKLVYLVGPGGHSNMATEECMCRAGMPVQLSPMIDCTNLLNGTTKSKFLQRNGKYAVGLLDEYNIGEGDVLVVINAYGINYLCVEIAIQARKRGVTVIGVSSPAHSDFVPADHPQRHPDGTNLKDVCDIFLDCKMPYGDAAIELEGAEQKVGPTSALCNIFTIDMLMLSADEELIEMGVTPKIWRSANIPGADQYNAKNRREYGQRIRFLL